MKKTLLFGLVFVLLITFSCTQKGSVSIQKQIISVGGSVAGAPYSPGVLAGNTLYTAGRLGTIPATGELGSDISEQTRLALESIKLIVEAAGLTMSDVVNISVFLADVSDFNAMNEVYKTFFPVDPPARTTVAVAGLVKNALIEISAIAYKSGK